jgi:hypothetical protein
MIDLPKSPEVAFVLFYGDIRKIGDTHSILELRLDSGAWLQGKIITRGMVHSRLLTATTPTAATNPKLTMTDAY